MKRPLGQTGSTGCHPVETSDDAEPPAGPASQGPPQVEPQVLLPDTPPASGPLDSGLMQRYVAHEFRSHLNVVVGAATLLGQRWSSQDERGRRLCASLKGSAALLLRLIDDWHGTDPAAATGFSFECRALALEPWLTTWLAACPVMDTTRSADLAATRPPLMFNASTDVCVLADPQRLSQCLFNLLGNAFKYGGDPAGIALEVHQAADAVTIVVSDAGPGLRPEQIAQLFQPFVRLEPGTATPGQGLGLSLTRLLVEAMGGRISVDSTVGVGTRFTLALRRALVPGDGIGRMPADAAERRDAEAPGH